MKVPIADWKCSPKERKYVNQVLDSGWLTYGPFCKKLESKWADYHNCQFGVINNSGTSALQLAFRALKELKDWDNDTEILVPACTFPATINMVIESGLKPVLVEVELDGGYKISDVKAKIGPKTKGICIVHLWGNPHPRKKELLKAVRGLEIVEDSCETISREVGHWGAVSCFSMYFNHIISAGVGGMACTNDSDLEYIMRSLANHGMINVKADPKYKRFNFSRVGYSMRVTEMEAALGLAQFENIDGILKKRKEISELLDSELRRVGFDRRAVLIGGIMMYPMVLKDFYGCEQFMSVMHDKGIETRTMMPITNQPVFRYLWEGGKFPNADRIAEMGVFLPIHPRMSKIHVAHIIKAIESFKEELV